MYKALLPITNDKVIPIPGITIFCELKNKNKFIGIYDETLDMFIDTEDGDKDIYYPRSEVIWYTEYEVKF